MHKYIIMGVQGSGKGTQARMLQQELDLVHISVGDILRWNIKNHTKLGARTKRLVSGGQLVPDEMVEEVVRTRLGQHDWNFGFILDGFPRNHVQAEFYLENFDCDALIMIDVPDEIVMERIMARRLCSLCGLDFNLIHHRPAASGKCDVCGGELILRPDDKPEAIKIRLRDYHTKTQPTLELFRKKGLIVQLDGNQSAEVIYENLRSQLGLPPREIRPSGSGFLRSTPMA